MDYESSLDRAMEDVPDLGGSDERLSVPDPETQKDGAFTRLTNLSAIADALSRDPEHVHSKIQQELGYRWPVRGRASPLQRELPRARLPDCDRLVHRVVRHLF